MENRITKKKSIDKAQFIVSMLPPETSSVFVVQYILEFSPFEMSNWNSNTIHELEYQLFNFIIPKNYYRHLHFYVRSLEIEALTENQEIFTLRFIFVLDLNSKNAEQIGITFRNHLIKSEIGGNFNIRMSFLDQIDLFILINPIQLYSEKTFFPEWLMEMIIERPLIVLPKSFFESGLYKNINKSFY
jgi:hypothetical protein